MLPPWTMATCPPLAVAGPPPHRRCRDGLGQLTATAGGHGQDQQSTLSSRCGSPPTMR